MGHSSGGESLNMRWDKGGGGGMCHPASINILFWHSTSLVYHLQ